jgi:hypothetical protein
VDRNHYRLFDADSRDDLIVADIRTHAVLAKGMLLRLTRTEIDLPGNHGIRSPGLWRVVTDGDVSLSETFGDSRVKLAVRREGRVPVFPAGDRGKLGERESLEEWESKAPVFSRRLRLFLPEY